METDDKQQTAVGASLAAGREALGITQTEAADVLNLTQRTIAALEADDYDNLPGWVYASGYIRAYARMLGLDADDLVARSSAMRQ
ncbi:MAG: helix-turn-helix transcriptional regulator, partial [Pseudomonadota bacterium]|nr:helix-turn-helix transcriptional regulator [Pseudomonadota bacterium]